MVAMARALMPDPQVLLLDEPSAGLAPAFVDAIFEKTEEVNRAGVTIVMVEQNARRALAMSDRGYVLDLGKDRFEGPGEELLADPKVAELYLGGTAAHRRGPTRRRAIEALAWNAKRPGPEGPGRLCDSCRRVTATGCLGRCLGTIGDRARRVALELVDVVDAGGRVAVLVQVDRAGGALSSRCRRRSAGP